MMNNFQLLQVLYYEYLQIPLGPPSAYTATTTSNFHHVFIPAPDTRGCVLVAGGGQACMVDAGLGVLVVVGSG